ncbi:MAG: phasin family protein [Methylotetracoccus sp.]|jgi:hypothetical protein|nr:phasin family protein [Methylotetracoccus sp.]
MNAPYNQWLEMNRAAMAPMLQWSELAATTADKLARQGLTVAQDLLDLGARQMQLAGEVKDPQKWAVEESKLISEYGQKILGRAGDYLSISKDVRESVVSWAENTAKTTAESIKATAESITPKAAA